MQSDVEPSCHQKVKTTASDDDLTMDLMQGFSSKTAKVSDQSNYLEAWGQLRRSTGGAGRGVGESVSGTFSSRCLLDPQVEVWVGTRQPATGLRKVHTNPPPPHLRSLVGDWEATSLFPPHYLKNRDNDATM